LADAIANGLLKASPVLAKRLASAESELERLQSDQRRTKAPVAGRIMPNVRKVFLAIVYQLEANLKRNPERARASLADLFGEHVALEPDESDRFLWAEYGLGAVPMLAQAVGSEIMVAGVGFEPTTFGL
jgi:hypothetical protein